jgi:outer membrane protein TolC
MIVKKVVRYLWVLIPHLIIAQSEVQVISLQECFQQAMNNHPIADRPALIEKVESVRQLQVTRSRYPDIFWNSNIVLQSAVPDLDLNFPESVGDPIDLPLYNFQSYLEAAYTVYDAGLTQLKSKEAELMMTVDNQRVTVDLEKLKSETAKYFYGVLLMRKRVQILLKSVESLSSQKDRLAAALEYGTALKSDVAQLDVEIAETRGRIADIQRSGKKFLRLLEGLTGTSFPDSVKLEVPNFDVPPSDQLGRAELLLFEYEKELSNHRSGYLEASLRPTVSVFSRAGFGYPNPLNFFQDEL